MRRPLGRRRPLLLLSLVVFVLVLLFLLYTTAARDERIRPYDLLGENYKRIRDDDKRTETGAKPKEHVAPEGEEVLPAVEGKAPNRCAATFDTSCKTPRIHVQIAAETDSHPPYACFNDISVFSEADVGRGLLAARLDPETEEVNEVANFDVSTTDGKLISWLGKLPERAIVIVASFGDVAERISPDARRAFERIGANRSADWRGGSAYALLGQRGLERGAAKEIIAPLGRSVSPTGRLISDCFEFPLGNLNASIDSGPDVNRVDEAKLAELLKNTGQKQHTVELGEEWKNCGRSESCGDDTPMYFYSGANKDDHPRMCVGGRMVFSSELNNAGRGLNIAVIDQKSRRIVRTGHFDTYERESTDVELFLDGLNEGEIVAVVSFDEASTMLSDMAKQIFYELGSSMIHRLKFRASWYFVGQKGIRVFSPFEDLNFATGNAWATPIDTSVCVPLSLSGPAEQRKSKQNAAKRHFCTKYDRLDEFCEESHLDDPIVPRPLKEARRADEAIFNVPILVVGSVNLGRLRWALESLIAQEGINTQLVIVAHHIDYKMAGDLALLFHFKPLPINTTSSYSELVLAGISAAFSVFPKAQSLIVIEEEVAVSPDLLRYFSQLLRPLEADPSLDFVSAFNYNGFSRTSANASLVYRVDDQPLSYAYLMKRALYDAKIANKNHTACCSRIHHWSLGPLPSLVPDVSRVAVPRPDTISLTDSGEANVFKEPREFNTNQTVLVKYARTLKETLYPQEIRKLMDRSMSFDGSALEECKEGYEREWSRIDGKREDKPVVIHYKNKNALLRILSCLGLYRNKEFVAGSWKGFVRFHLHNTPVTLAPYDNIDN